MLNRMCPGCKRFVPILAPRQLRNSQTLTIGWRRRAHAVEGGLSAIGAVRCRYPVALTPEEQPQEVP